MFACLYRPPAPDEVCSASIRSLPNAGSLVAIAQEFSPRYERHREDLVSIDVRGLERLLGTPRVIAHELRREAADRGVHVHVAIAGTRIASLVFALARPGITVVDRGGEAAALAPLPIGILDRIATQSNANGDLRSPAESVLSVFKTWGIRTLGELAALPPADLAARLGQQGLAWQAIARGEDIHPLVPTLADERFESSLELDWPIEGLEPLSFVLTRLLEPLSTRLERRDRGAAVLHVRLRLVTTVATLHALDRPEAGRGPTSSGRAEHARRLELPAPIRDVRTLRTLALLDLESHPPPAAIDAVTVVIDPTPGRVLQHALFTRRSTGSRRPELVEGRTYPTPDEISTLLARLGALMGQDRIGAPSVVDTYRPGAFEMTSFATQHFLGRVGPHSHALKTSVLQRPVLDTREGRGLSASGLGVGPQASKNVVSALRRFRHPVPARVAVDDGRPVRVVTDRRGFAGGSVVAYAGPWRTSGNWWSDQTPWDRDEWDVALSDGAVYRVYRNRETDGWFIDAIVD